MKNKYLNKMLTAAAAIFALTMGIVACNKDAIVADNAGSIGGAKWYAPSPNDSIAFGLPRNSLIMLADSHNYHLNTILDEFDFTSFNIDDEIDRCMGLIPQNSRAAYLYDSVFSSVYTCDIEDVDIESAVYELGGITETEQVVSLLTAVDAERIATSTTYQIHLIADSIMSVANYNLTGGDLLTVEGFVRVLEASSKYWLPYSQGGYAHWEWVCDRLCDEEPQPPQDSTDVSHEVGEVVLADCVEAAKGCILTAVVGAMFPPMAGKLLFHAALKSAAASAKKAVEKGIEHVEQNSQN